MTVNNQWAICFFWSGWLRWPLCWESLALSRPKIHANWETQFAGACGSVELHEDNEPLDTSLRNLTCQKHSKRRTSHSKQIPSWTLGTCPTLRKHKRKTNTQGFWLQTHSSLIRTTKAALNFTVIAPSPEASTQNLPQLPRAEVAWRCGM